VNVKAAEITLTPEEWKEVRDYRIMPVLLHHVLSSSSILWPTKGPSFHHKLATKKLLVKHWEFRVASP